MKTFGLAGVLLVLALPVHASDNAQSAAFEACAAKAHGATFPLLHCYAQEMQADEDAMMAIYNAVTAAASDAKSKDYLTASQAAWTSYRDAWCEATVPRGGSLARLKLMECRIAQTARRTAELKALESR